MDQGFIHVRVEVKDYLAAVEYENARHLSDARAMGRVMRTAAALTPADVPHIRVVALRRRVPVLKITFQSTDFMGFLAGKYTAQEFRKLVKLEKADPAERVAPAAREPGILPASMEPEIMDYGLKPAAETWLDDPSGFFKVRLGVDAWGAASLWDGSEFYGWLNIPLYNDISSRVAPLGEDPVRSDIVRYKERNEPRLNSFLLDQVANLGKGTFGRFTVGYMDTQYAGVGAEVLHLLGEGRWSVGVLGDFALKRDPVHPFALKEFQAFDILGSLNYLQPDLGLAGKLRFGRFLGGDPGARLEVARHWDTGASFGFWYTYTDTSGFDDPFNRGYQDKGIFISVPLAMFTREDSAVKHSYAFSPWIRDVGQTVGHFNLLYEFLEDLLPAHVGEHVGEMKN
jgi:hypothetical protein